MFRRIARSLDFRNGIHTSRSEKNSKANLLIISYDQWRGDWGNANRPIINLPTMQHLAKNGLIIESCYTNSPQCVPARFSWLTGLEPSQLGVTRNENISLPKDAPSKIRKLKEKGWHTRIIGKTHWSTHNEGGDIREKESLVRALGFENITEIVGPRALRTINCQITDDWEKEGLLEAQRNDLDRRYRNKKSEEAWRNRETILPNHLYPDIWIANRAEEQIEELPLDGPWILWVSFVGPHEPFDTPRPWRGMTKGDEIPKTIKQREWIRNLDNQSQIKQIQKKWENKMTTEQIDSLRRDYADHLRLLDEQTKRIIEKLEMRSDFENTGIVLMSDHGEMLGDGNMLYKSTFVESSINVPMIYRQPMGNKRKEVLNKPINLTGLFIEILNNLEYGGKMEYIKKWSDKQTGAVVEFARERLFIIKSKKLCLDYEGNILWATDIEKDPCEYTNEALTYNFKIDKEWLELKKWARKTTVFRGRLKWVWRDLVKNKYDQTSV